MKQQFVRDSASFYHVWISAAEGSVFFRTSYDKAFFIMLFQDYLGPQSERSDWSRYHQGFASQIGLIAYSLTDFGVNLLVHSASVNAVADFGQTLLSHYAAYLSQQRSWEVLPFDTIFVHEKLADEHAALKLTRHIHLLHDDWRYDRYSSIGFFLDDRRGSWLEPWRITDLFNNDADWYYHYLHDIQDTPAASVSYEFIET